MITYPVYVCENLQTSPKKPDGSYLVLDQIKEGTQTHYVVTSFKTDREGEWWHWDKEFSSLDKAQAEFDRFK